VAELIPVIVSTHNCEDALDALPHSLAGQTDRAFKLVIADDARMWRRVRHRVHVITCCFRSKVRQANRDTFLARIDVYLHSARF
jgi:hypothetical protein